MMQTSIDAIIPNILNNIIGINESVTCSTI